MANVWLGLGLSRTIVQIDALMGGAGSIKLGYGGELSISIERANNTRAGGIGFRVGENIIRIFFIGMGSTWVVV